MKSFFIAPPQNPLYQSTTQPHSTLSPTQCPRLWLSSSASCLFILQACRFVYVVSSERSFNTNIPGTQTHLPEPVSVCWGVVPSAPVPNHRRQNIKSSSIPHELCQSWDGKRGHVSKYLPTILKPKPFVLIMTSRNITDLNYFFDLE